jgi:hypothetical protein
MGCIAPSEPKGVVADATSSSTTGHHAACTWCSYSSAAVSRAVGARDRPRWPARVRCASGVARPARAEARGDDQHRAASARPAEARRARAFEGGGRAAVGPDGEARTALPRLPRVDFGPSLLGAKRRQGADHPGRLSGVHAVGGPSGQHARPLLPTGRVRSRQDSRGRVGHGQLRRLTALGPGYRRQDRTTLDRCCTFPHGTRTTHPSRRSRLPMEGRRRIPNLACGSRTRTRRRTSADWFAVSCVRRSRSA